MTRHRRKVAGKFGAMSSVSRRSFLVVGVGLAATAACGDGDKKASPSARTLSESPGRAPDALEVIPADPQLIAGADQRITVGVLQEAEPLTAKKIQLTFGRTLERLGAPVTAELHSAGIEKRPYYRAEFRFEGSGQWWVQASSGGKSGSSPLTVINPEDAQTPLPGQSLISVATPTTANPRGVDPICTRNPQCPFHEVSLDAALNENRPLAVLFATPALCQSRVCGPVLDILMAEAPAYANDVRFIHVEVYKNLQAQFRVEDLTEGMRAFHLTFEPILYLAGADGIVQKRLGGPFDRTEASAALAQLA